MAAIMPNLASHDVRALWMPSHIKKHLEKVTDVQGAGSYDSDVANIAHGAAND